MAQSASGNMMKDVMTSDKSMRSSKLIGAVVYNDEGDKIGSIIDILVRGGAVEPIALVSVGDYLGGGTKLVAFPVGKLQLDAAKAMMQGASKRAIQAMPAFELNFGGSG
jgi:hypothetical protein